MPAGRLAASLPFANVAEETGILLVVLVTLFVPGWVRGAFVTQIERPPYEVRARVLSRTVQRQVVETAAGTILLSGRQHVSCNHTHTHTHPQARVKVASGGKSKAHSTSPTSIGSDVIAPYFCISSTG